MKLSDAILLGSTLGPQAFRMWFDGDAACALGAASLAVGARLGDGCGNRHDLPKEWQRFAWDGFDVRCPACDRSSSFPANVITHLNDFHRWTRERIALEFVRPLEAIYDNEQASSEDYTRNASGRARVVPSGGDSGQIEAELVTA